MKTTKQERLKMGNGEIGKWEMGNFRNPEIKNMKNK